jgi:hypothetical protein
MAQFTLKAAPTFKAKVSLPVPGGGFVPVEFTFKHRTKKALDEFVKTREGKSDAESFASMVAGWELDDAFTPENIDLLLENRIGSALATYRVYIEELTKAREGN